MSGSIGGLEQDNGMVAARVEAMAETNHKQDVIMEEHRSISYAMAHTRSEVVAPQCGAGVNDGEGVAAYHSLIRHRLLMAFGLTAPPRGDHYDVLLSVDDNRHMVGTISADEPDWGFLTITPDRPLAHFEHIPVTPRPSARRPISDEGALGLSQPGIACTASRIYRMSPLVASAPDLMPTR